MSVTDQPLSGVSTLYIRNLNEKVGITTLTKKLRSVFAKNNWGEVVSITARKNLKSKGQAFVAFKSPSECQKCLQEFQKLLDNDDDDDDGFLIFDKKPEISLAKTDSDMALQCKFPPTTAEELINDRKLKKQQREKAIKEEKEKEEEKELERKKQKQQGNSDNANNKRANSGDSQELPPSKKTKVDLSALPPNKNLLLQNLPSDITEDSLVEIFGKFAGFVEIRLVKVRNVSFVEYESEADSMVVKEKLGTTFKIGDVDVSLNYAKK
ncbi:Mud1 protein [Saccharomycopsis crataegensis]|uniref:Mud1 protein n=1 Tax=Saccharomycopsis crataegensis TaxID=43959 RepID=A0AAV5QPL5_9ASCO|nr:Mud1 protein [Saccharomycopsis crataegensis]